MKPADLRSESEVLKTWAKAVEAELSAASTDKIAREILIQALRARMVEDVSKIVQYLDKEARKKDEEIRNYPSTHKGKEVWIFFFLDEKGNVGYNATIMKAESAPFIAAKMKRQSSIWHTRHELFLELIEDLKQQILDGRHDEKLRMKPARLIYDLLWGRV